MADRYPFYLVTRGRDKAARHPDRLLPLVLLPKENGLREVARAVEGKLRTIAFAFTFGEPTALEVIKAVSQPWIARALPDLWLSEVRQVARGAPLLEDEEAIDWVLIGDVPERLPQPWQGPADSVIPTHAPVTVRLPNLAPFKVAVTT